VIDVQLNVRRGRFSPNVCSLISIPACCHWPIDPARLWATVTWPTGQQYLDTSSVFGMPFTCASTWEKYLGHWATTSAATLVASGDRIDEGGGCHLLLGRHKGLGRRRWETQWKKCHQPADCWGIATSKIIWTHASVSQKFTPTAINHDSWTS